MNMARVGHKIVSLLIGALMIAPWLASVSASDQKYTRPPLVGRYTPLNEQFLSADIDGDRVPDAVEFSSYGEDKSVRISLSGSATYTLSFDPGKYEPGRLVLDDIDHDNDQDLVWYSQTDSKAIFFWLNDGKGRFGPATRYRPSEQRDLDLSRLIDRETDPRLLGQERDGGLTCGLRTNDSPVVETAVRSEAIAPASSLTSESEPFHALPYCLKSIFKRGPPAHLS
jgi:hypothetical protein